MRRPNHGCASAVKTKTSPEPPETLAPQFDYWAPKSRISAAFTLTKAPKSGSWVYLLVAIVRKRLRLEVSLYTLLQVFSLTVFEKLPIQSAILATPDRFNDAADSNQLKLFTF